VLVVVIFNFGSAVVMFYLGNRIVEVSVNEGRLVVIMVGAMAMVYVLEGRHGEGGD
jgi:hypothetical protein